MSKTLKRSASTWPCLFATLTEKYADKQLKPCETKSEQHIRQASGDKVKGCIKQFSRYFTELYSLTDECLDNLFHL